MATTKKTTTRASRPGYEPSKGFPDPQASVQLGARRTHMPNGSGTGTVCNKRPVPTKAADYDAQNPTCEVCANYLSKAKLVTAARHPEAVARQAAKQRAAAPAPDDGEE